MLPRCTSLSIPSNSLCSSKPNLVLALFWPSTTEFTLFSHYLHVAPCQGLRKAVLVCHWHASGSRLHHAPSEHLEAKHFSYQFNIIKLTIFKSTLKMEISKKIFIIFGPLDLSHLFLSDLLFILHWLADSLGRCLSCSSISPTNLQLQKRLTQFLLLFQFGYPWTLNLLSKRYFPDTPRVYGRRLRS